MIPVAACMAWHATICGSLAMLPALPFTATATPTGRPGGKAGSAAPSSRLMQGTAAGNYQAWMQPQPAEGSDRVKYGPPDEELNRGQGLQIRLVQSNRHPPVAVYRTG